jgi:hypothetical protein
MHAVLPWPWEHLCSAHQEPNYSFGGPAPTVSLWKPDGLDLTELCSHSYYGCPREDELLTRVPSGSKKSIAHLYQMGKGARPPTPRRNACFLPRHEWTGRADRRAVVMDDTTLA